MPDFSWRKLAVPDDELFCQSTDCANEAGYITWITIGELEFEVVACELCVKDSGCEIAE
jgi:hypothetical protein